MATHSSVLAWRIPGTGEPGGLPSVGSHRVVHDWSDLAAARCSSVGEWVYKLWHIQTMDYYSELNWNEILSHKKTRRNLKCILGERNQSEKTTWNMVSNIWCFENGKTTVKKSVVVKGWMGAEMNWWSTEGLGESETILYSAQYHRMNTFVKVHRMYNTKSELYWLCQSHWLCGSQ